MKKGALEFEEVAKIVLAIVIIILVVSLVYIVKDKIVEVIRGAKL